MLRGKLVLRLSLMLILFSACSTNEGEDLTGLEGAQTLKFHELTKVSEGDLYLEVVNIADYRCPLGKVCDSPGAAQITFKAVTALDSINFRLDVGKILHEGRCTDTIMGHRIEVIDLSPYPDVNYPAQKGEAYKVWVKILKLN
jgi:hypothetical protein